MKRDLICVKKWESLSYMDFLLRTNGGMEYLFTIEYDKGIHEFFGPGKSMEHLLRRTGWKKNPKLCRLIKKRIPYAIKQIKKGVKDE